MDEYGWWKALMIIFGSVFAMILIALAIEYRQF